MSVRILQGDCRQVLKTLADDCVHCVVTSPPYFGLRDYGMDGQIGLEESPAAYINRLVDVFHEVRRIMRPDGTLWLNLGDSYAGSGKGGNKGYGTSTICGRQPDHSRVAKIQSQRRDNAPVPSEALAHIGFKAKNLMMMPARVAIALQEDGWYLRQEIIWSKPNPMPESVTDRCTKAHEYIYLLSKSTKYYFDADAISEPVADSTIQRVSQPNLGSQEGSPVPGKTNGNMKAVGGSDRRNKRSVWEITTKGFSEAHFATFPPELPELCIKAGSPRGGGSTGPLRWRWHHWTRRGPVAARFHPNRAESRICRHGRAPCARRRASVCGGD